ncbi:hypothetical protein M378DRAFT_162024 [Amanita muscaria Koide BX008]|uniref:Uncharacterized protein n=1 Tax=Amanita muscaria (strain Koide BX008) TaxID=946122 RepID=A0A0C2WUE7_AMAMK|nr:hypothetical protein M378DRAFT_162024 [Amanita muscaria Koide BX008]
MASTDHQHFTNSPFLHRHHPPSSLQTSLKSQRVLLPLSRSSSRWSTTPTAQMSLGGPLPAIRFSVSVCDYSTPFY